MTRLALYAVVICQSLLMSFASGVDAQQKYLREIEIELPSYENADLKVLINDIQDRSDFEFASPRRLISKKSISLEERRWNMEHLLREISTQAKVSIRRVNETISFSEVESQVLPDVVEVKTIQVSVSGTITDENGEGLPGATIQEKGTTNGTITDVEGKFSLDVPENATLIVSFVGYKTREVVATRDLTINLSPDFGNLSEVVVVGYGTAKKSDLTGAVASVNAKDLNGINAVRIDEALQGKAAGLQITSISGAPGAGMTIRIRGGNSISATNEPLYVIDGFAGVEDLNSINPKDIKSIEILKDASATAIYGSRGANGVILIQTKEGESGKPTISVDLGSGFQQLARNIPLATGNELAIIDNINFQGLGQPIPYPNPGSVPNIDWQDLLFQSAPMTQATVSISGGSGKSRYYFSTNYLDQKGIYVKTGFEKLQTRVNLTTDLNEWLSSSIKLNYANFSQDNKKFGDSGNSFILPSLMSLYDDDGEYNVLLPISGIITPNPVALSEMVTNFTENNQFQGNTALVATLKNGLTFKSTFGAYLTQSKQNIYEPGGLPSRKIQGLLGQGRITTNFDKNILNENTVNYTKDFGKHSISILAGNSYQTYQKEGVQVKGSGFTNDLTSFNNLGLSDPTMREIGSSFNKWTIVSFIGRINYSFANKYLFTGNIRRDGSSRLGENNRWAVFPSGAFAWKLDQEDFIRNLELFDNLKLRISYGVSGNQAVDVYATQPTLSQTVFILNGGEQQLAYNQGNLANSNLKWETTTETNVGLDFGFLDGRLTFNTNIYIKTTQDLLLNVQIPRTTGYSSRIENIGKVGNRGLEVLCNAVIFSKGDFEWSGSFNIALNRNKLLDVGSETGWRDVTEGLRLIEGQTAPVFYGAVYEGTWKSGDDIPSDYMGGATLLPGDPRFKDVDGNGSYDGVGDYTILGSPEPDFFGGIGSNLSYKHWSMNMFFNYSYGNEIFNYFGSSIYLYSNDRIMHADYAADYWTSENPDGYYANPYGRRIGDTKNRAISLAVQDGSYLRLQTLKIAYSIPESWIPGIEGSIYFTGKNLFLWTNYDSGFDPDVNSTGTSSVVRGFDYGMNTYPRARTFLAGINFKF